MTASIEVSCIGLVNCFARPLIFIGIGKGTGYKILHDVSMLVFGAALWQSFFHFFQRLHFIH